MPKQIPIATKLQLCNYGLYYKSLEQFQDYDVYFFPRSTSEPRQTKTDVRLDQLEFKLTEDMEGGSNPDDYQLLLPTWNKLSRVNLRFHQVFSRTSGKATVIGANSKTSAEITK